MALDRRGATASPRKSGARRLDIQSGATREPTRYEPSRAGKHVRAPSRYRFSSVACVDAQATQETLGRGGSIYDRGVIDLFAGICVSNYEAARRWYERLFGSEPSFVAHETECVWELGEHRFIFIVEDPGRAGHAVITIFVDDLDALVEDIASRGVEPAQRETYSNGVRKATYRDPDGNEIGYGGSPVG